MSELKRLLITGTSSGIGKELLKQAAATGAGIIAVDKERDPELEKICSTASFRELDLTDAPAVDDLVRSLAAEGLLPDVVVLNAAVLDVDNEPYIDFEKLRRILDINLLSALKMVSALMPRLRKGATFIFVSSGVIIFPNPTNLGYFLGKLGITRVFDVFDQRYACAGFRFKSAILGPVDCGMLKGSREPGGLAGFLRKLTTGTPEAAAAKILSLATGRRRHVYYRRSSATILWAARIVQAFLPPSLRAYKVK